MFTLRSQFHILNCSNFTNSPKKTTPISHLKRLSNNQPTKRPKNILVVTNERTDRLSRRLVVGTLSVGLAALLMGLGDGDKALAFGPEGPLMEEFWDNVRRYAIYALTVSTGALYTIYQPIAELLKNPISAILILALLGGGVYAVSQVVQAMLGVTDFSYEYTY